METITDFCKRCNGYRDFERIETPELTHKAKLICLECKWFKWEPKNDKPTKRTVKSLLSDIDFCYCCLRHKFELPNGVVLHEHHILPYYIFPEYDNDIRNRWMLCTRCHSIIEDVRKTVVDYINLTNTEYNLSKMFKEYELSRL